MTYPYPSGISCTFYINPYYTRVAKGVQSRFTSFSWQHGSANFEKAKYWHSVQGTNYAVKTASQKILANK